MIYGLDWLIRRLRAFPVDIDAADSATRAAVRLLRSEEAVMMFPEAGRSDDERLQRFRGGAFRLACSLGVPITGPDGSPRRNGRGRRRIPVAGQIRRRREPSSASASSGRSMPCRPKPERLSC